MLLTHSMLSFHVGNCLSNITLPTPSKEFHQYLQREIWCLHLFPLHENSCASWDGNVCLQWLLWSKGKDVMLLLYFFDSNGSYAPVGRVITPSMAVERAVCWKWRPASVFVIPGDSGGLQWVLRTNIQKTPLAATSLRALHLSTETQSIASRVEVDTSAKSGMCS